LELKEVAVVKERRNKYLFYLYLICYNQRKQNIEKLKKEK
jgi:hypothetical protein